MDLSVIIVNYNVRHFLEQCLSSVFNALDGISAEVFVVDNNSADGSCSMVESKFPLVRLIRNNTNRGFSAANNQAIEISSGKYLLLLNPDTVLPENALKRCIEFMNSNTGAGAVGLKMIDGRGKYLPESKRGLPTPAAAFYRISGLYKLFPRSAVLNRYYHGNLDVDSINEIEILTGAFMFIRHEAIAKTGGFDESFFMYGEDIDLSYRITLAGYKNYYLPEPAIIHYKGESTRKSDINYFLHFYRSMIIFAEKHFRERGSAIFMFFIRFAVTLRGLFSAAGGIAGRFISPLVEGFSILALLYLTAKLWGISRFGNPDYFPPLFTSIVLPAYSVAWISALYAWGAYRRRVPILSPVKGILTGTLIILSVYALLPAHLRFSRAVILIGTIFILSFSLIYRYLLSLTGVIKLTGLPGKSKRVIIASGHDEYFKISAILSENRIRYTLAGRVAPFEDDPHPHLGTFTNLEEVIRINQPDEIIFSSADIKSALIIEAINRLSDQRIDKKIARTASDYVIGSDSPSKQGEIYTLKLEAKKEV